VIGKTMWILLCLVSSLASADTMNSKTAELSIETAQIRLPLPGQSTAVVYLRFSNHSSRDRSVSEVKVEGAAASELHQHIHRDGMMRMRRLDSIAVPAGTTLMFESGSYHIMAFRMAAADGEHERNGRTYNVTIIMADGEQVTAKAQPITL
jgi:periplasmic copper chaperone A